MEKTIFRKAKSGQNPYAQILRKSIQNPELSLKAKGLLSYILSLPDNWQIYQIELVRHFKDGEFAIRSAIKELQKAGHIKGKRKRDESGKIRGYEYIVYEDPEIKIDLPETGHAEAYNQLKEKMYADQQSGYGIEPRKQT